MVVEKGYKQTEIGVIPEDWEVTKIGSIAEVIGGGTPSTTINQFWGGAINWYTPTEVGGTKYLLESKRKLTTSGLKNSSARILPIGTILMTSRAGIGDLGILSIESATNQGFQSLVALSNVNNEYLYYLMLTQKSVLLQNASGSTFLEISPSKVKSIVVPLPTLPEQTAIANSLSDMDALIAQTSTLIEKKKAIKQGVMQELLKPKEGWVTKKLGDYCQLITKGTTPTSIGMEFRDSGVNFLKIESLGGDGKVIPDKVAFIDTKTHELLKRSQIKAGDILFSIAGYLGRIALVDENIVPANTNQALAIIRLKNDSELQNNFLFWYLNHSQIQNHISTISVQGAQANLSLQNIADFEIQMPKAQTQIAISELLNNFEQSIQILITKLQKLKLQKQGMMQALLTGKIRLG
jgi:type I restriction enzyme S subunit